MLCVNSNLTVCELAKLIAIVEDDPDQRSNYTDAITKKGYSVNAYGGREEALEGIEQELPDLAILDIILGEEVDAGFQLCRDLLAKAPDLPVIFLTERIDEIDKISGLRLGAWDYLPKPINPDILLGKVKVFLQLEEQRIKLEQVSKELRMSSRKNKLLLDCASEGIVGLDQEGQITFINPTACEMLSGTEENLLNSHIRQYLFSEDDNPEEQWQSSDIYQQCLVKGERLTHSVDLFKVSGASFPAEMNIAAMQNSQKKVQGAVLVFQDITERKKLEDQLLQMAKYDSLTGLANRSLFMEFLEASLARNKRRSKVSAVMFLDLDHFKEINDTLGHDAGDRLLNSVAQRVKSCVREGDLVARLGGDEFAIVLDDVANAEDTRIIAEKILEALKKPHDLGETERAVGTSIGIAAFPEAGEEPDALIKAADEAMYVAKKGGRNGYRFHSEIDK